MTDDAKLLIDLFKHREEAGSITVLMLDEGFAVESLRVLAAWKTARVEWTEPKDEQPDEGEATPAAWRWLWSGTEYDIEGIAATASVTTSVARAQIEMLIGARLVYPDNAIAKAAQAAMNELARQRLMPKGAQRAQKQGPEPRKPKPSPDDAN